jgi:PAS domain S-box-containing protein
VRLPALLSPPYLIMLAAMTFELSRDTLRAPRLARELRDSEARLEIAASAAGLGIWTWDAVRARMWATAGACEMFGQRADEPLDIARMAAMIHPDEVARIESVWRNAAHRGTEEEVQFQITLPDGTKRWLLARGRSEADSRGTLTSIKGVVRDVTEQFRAREEIEELRRDLAHAGRVSVLGTLSSSLAHELSQPLGAILLNAEAGELLLQRPNPDLEEVRQILADIHRDDHRAAEVIDRLRSLLKHRKLDFSPVSVDGLLQDVASLLRSDAIARNVTLEYSSDPGLPLVRGDKVHLSQVLINLAMNAMDAVAEQPASRRRVVLRARGAEPGWVEISVTDSGPGVPENLLKKVFDPFFTTKAAGMGMGLSVSRTIVDSHGGRLWVENGVGGGATFLVALPAVT